LWRLHFIRQNILQKHLTLWKFRNFVDEINKTSTFAQDEIYQHKIVGNKLFSWNRLRIVGPMDYEHRYTIPELVQDQDTYWSPTKLIAMISGSLAAGTALAYGLYNLFFAGSTSADISPFYVQVSLSVINNRSLSSIKIFLISECSFSAKSSSGSCCASLLCTDNMLQIYNLCGLHCNEPEQL